MEPICNELGKVRGMEILYFENAEVEKVKGNSTSFATFGSLSVLFFKDYNRYVLTINDWRYPLLNRLPALGLDKEDPDSRSYSLPAPHGFAYNLKINKAGGSFAFHNLDAIFEQNSRFTWKDSDQAFRKAEESPDDHLVRHIKKEKGSGVISEGIKHSIHSMKHKIETMKTGTKHLTSRKSKLDPKSLKTKNFRKGAHSKIKGDFIKSSEKHTSEFWQLRRGNLNNIVSRKFEDIRKLAHGPSLYLWREELEEAILNNKDIAAQGLSAFHLALQKDEKPVERESTWSDLSTQPSVTQSLISQGTFETRLKDRSDSLPERERKTEFEQESEVQAHRLSDKLAEGLSHYQG